LAGVAFEHHAQLGDGELVELADRGGFGVAGGRVAGGEEKGEGGENDRGEMGASRSISIAVWHRRPTGAGLAFRLEFANTRL
jgi:hypothetical protein